MSFLLIHYSDMSIRFEKGWYHHICPSYPHFGIMRGIMMMEMAHDDETHHESREENSNSGKIFHFLLNVTIISKIVQDGCGK